jgi:hypothetical protein
MGRYRTAQTWKIIAMFYSDESVEIDAEGSVHESATVSFLFMLFFLTSILTISFERLMW